MGFKKKNRAKQGPKMSSNFYGQVEARKREKHAFSADLAKEAVRLVVKKEEGGGIDQDAVLEKAYQIERVGVDGKRVGRSAIEKAVKGIVNQMKQVFLKKK